MLWTCGATWFGAVWKLECQPLPGGERLAGQGLGSSSCHVRPSVTGPRENELVIKKSEVVRGKDDVSPRLEQVLPFADARSVGIL